MNRNSVIVTLAAIIIVAFKFVSSGAADVKYQIVDLGALSQSPMGRYSYARAINARGQIVGYSTIQNGNGQAFIWYNGSMKDLGTLGGNSSVGVAINDSGQATGMSENSNHQDRAFLYSDGMMRDIGTLGGNYSGASGINNRGQIIGTAKNIGGVEHPFLYSNGLMQDVSGILGNIYPTGINNFGDITGYSGYPASFLYINGLVKDVVSTPCLSYSFSVNDRGQVAGYFSIPPYTHSHPYLYNAGFLTDLGTLGGNSAWAYNINSIGDIVGSSEVNGDYYYHSFIYSNGKMHDLSSLVINGTGWTMERANGINDAGQIIGNGFNPLGQRHGFLLNPIPMESIQAISNVVPAQLILGICPVKDPTKNSLVVITHGWQPSLLQHDISFVDKMTIDIINNLSGHNVNNWQVFDYKWLDNAGGLNASDALNNAKQEGKHLGESIVAQGWTHVHFIAHSAGAALIQEATEVIKNANSSIVVHETFLDPFVGFDSAGVYTYGRRADWADQYFCRDELTEIGILNLPYTDSPTFHSYNVDISFLDPYRRTYNKFSSTPNGVQITESCSMYVQTTHGWPIDFYMNTITENTTADYAGFGFSLSEEGGNWSSVPGYSVGNGTELNPSVPVRVLGTNLVCTAVTPKTSSYSDFIPDFTQLPTIQSATGIIQKYINHINLFSGSPVWISTVIIPTNSVNFVSFDAKFTSGVGAQGVLVVLWDTNIVGTLDERFIEPGLQHYQFSFLRAEAYKPHVLGLRLDSFADVQSVITLTNITFNYVGVSQPFSLTITTNTVNGLRVLRLDGEVGFNYNVQASTNLNSSEWTDIAILENTNGAVFFYDTNQNIYNQRFYRAVAPY